MSPKLFVGLSLGSGGIAGGSYSILNYVYGEEIVVTPHSVSLTGTGKDVCTAPTQKATIIGNDNVEYYVCTTISGPTPAGTATNAPAPSFTSKNKSTFKQTTFPTAPQTSPYKGTYKYENNDPAIDIYGYKDMKTGKKDVFLIHKDTTEKSSKPKLTDIEDIKKVVTDIEELRKNTSITTTTASTESKK